MGNQQTSLEEVVVQGQSPWSNNKDTINRRLPSGQTLLSAEIQVPNVEIVKHLIKSGADTNITDKNGETPLNMAIRSKMPDMVAALLENSDTNVNKVGRFALAPIHVATVTRDAAVMQLVLNAGADPNTVYQAYNHGYQQQDNTSTPLHMAINFGDIAKILLQHGASVNIGNPLLKALQKSSLSVATQIVQHKTLDIEQLNESPHDVLAAAARIHHCHLVRNLVQKGICVQKMQDSEKVLRQTCAMAYVIHCDCRTCFEFLLPHITDFNAADMSGFTLIEYALNSSLWPCFTGRGNTDRHRHCLKPLQISDHNRKNIRLTNEWIHFVKKLLAKGADLSVVWNKLIWTQHQRHPNSVIDEREAVRFCIGAYHSSQTVCSQTYFRNLGIRGDLESMALVYLDGYIPSEEDLVVIENKIQTLSEVQEIEDTAFVKGNLHLIHEHTRTLRNIAVVAIRRSIGANVYKPVWDLPLPEQLKRLILLQDLSGMLPVMQ